MKPADNQTGEYNLESMASHADGGTVVAKEAAQTHVAEEKAAAALMEAASEAYHKYGVNAEGLRWVVDHCSDVCHRILKPATVGEGWENIPVLTNAELRYYDHEYRSLATGTVLHCGFQQSDIPPPGSRSYCEVRQSHWSFCSERLLFG